MLFFPENPELAFLYLYHLRLQEAEHEIRVPENPGDQTGLSTKLRSALESCLIRVKAFSLKPQPDASSTTIGGELGKMLH